MARNSLMPQMQLYDAPQAPSVAGFTNPLMQGLQTYRQGMQQQFEGDRALVAERRQGEQLKLAQNADSRAGEAQRMAKERAEVERLGKLAQVISDDPNDATASQRWQGILQGNPQMGELLQKYNVDPRDHRTGAKFLMAEVGSYMSPAQKEMEQAKLAQVKAQTANIGADSYTGIEGGILNKKTGQVEPLPAGVGGTKTSLNPIWGQDAQGNLVPMQPNSRGEAVQTKLPPGITPTKGVQRIDAGTHFVLINQMTGQTIGVIPKDVAGKEQQEALGQAAGKAEADLPRVTANAERALQTIEAIRNHPGKQYGVGAAGVVPGVPGTAQRGFVNLVDQAKGQTFLEAFNSLKGGGAITEAEGARATQALARLDRAQRPEDFEAALADLEAVVRRGLATAQSNAKLKGGNVQRATPADPGTAQPQAKGLAPGNYVYDPASGQLRPSR